MSRYLDTGNMSEQIDLAEFLLVAERVLGIDAKALQSTAKLGSAESALAARAFRGEVRGLGRHSDARHVGSPERAASWLRNSYARPNRPALNS